MRMLQCSPKAGEYNRECVSKRWRHVNVSAFERYAFKRQRLAILKDGRPQLALTSRQRFVLKVTPSGANIFSSVNGFKLRVIQAHTDIEDGKKNWKSLQKYTSLVVCFNMCIVAALAALQQHPWSQRHEKRAIHKPRDHNCFCFLSLFAIRRRNLAATAVSANWDSQESFA